MAKLIQVSDLHLTVPGTLLYGSDPLRRLEDCIADINANHADADLVIVSGDLTNDGEREAYEALHIALKALTPRHALMMGNHDDRDLFRSRFPHAAGADGFVQSVIDIGDNRIILLDTLQPGKVEGRLDQARLDWLARQLTEAKGQRVFLFAHHPPVDIGIPSLDWCKLADSEALYDLISRHGNVAHIFAGHVHRPVNGTWRGIAFTTMRSNNHQSALKFSGDYDVSAEPPAYNIILTGTRDVIVHMHEFRLRG